MTKSVQGMSSIAIILLISASISAETKVYHRIRLPELLSEIKLNDDVQQYTWNIVNPVLQDERTNLGWSLSKLKWISDILLNYRDLPPWLQVDTVNHKKSNEYVTVVFDSDRQMRHCEIKQLSSTDRENIKPFHLDYLQKFITVKYKVFSHDIDFNDYYSIVERCKRVMNPLVPASSESGTGYSSDISQTIRYPGTKWCGSGTSAKDFNDLGSARQTDMCCRAHDHCEDNIKANKRSGDFVNDSKWTISSCQCDDELVHFLK